MKRILQGLGLVAICLSLVTGDVLAQKEIFNFPGRLRELSEFLPGAEEAAPTQIKSGQSGFTFLKLPTDARTAAMGDAGNGLIGSAAGLFYNPATLAFLDSREAFFTQVQWIADIKMSVGGVAINLPAHGTVAVGFQTLDAGTFRGTAIDGDPSNLAGFNETGDFTTSNYAVTVGYGFKITDRFSFGASLKYASQDLTAGTIGDNILIGGQVSAADNSKSVVAFDVSTYFNTGFRNTVLAASIRNFSSELTYQRDRFELPRNIQLGLLFDLISLSGNTPAPHHLDLATDLNNPVDFDERVSLGLEYQFRQPGGQIGFSARGGWKFNHDTEDYSAGAGINWMNEEGRGFRVDYAFRHFNGNFFDNVNIFSAGIMF